MDTPRRPNIRIPEGFDLYFNSITGNWALRPVKGYSTTYYKKDMYIPKKKVEEKVETPTIFKEEETAVEGTAVEEKNSKNGNLHTAKKEKNDEFYTRLADIVDELKHYEEHFKDKVVYCPCDKLFNEGQSNFGRYFISKFHKLGLKKLVCTQYNPNGNGVVKEYDFEKCGVKWEYNGEKADGEPVDESDIDTYFLKGNGSFDSDECKEIMRNCDIVVTNPPFSMFRQFVEQIMTMGKKFLIIGNMNAVINRDIFPYLKSNKMWLGYNQPHYFEVPLDKVENEKIQYEEGGKIYQAFGNICWFTNLEHSKRKELIGLVKKYNPTDYPKYDNYDAIDVSKVTDIPKDYDGVMGVPISFFGKHNPKQFEILGVTNNTKSNAYALKENTIGYPTWASVNSKNVYVRLLIRKVKELPTEEEVKIIAE